MVIKMKLKDSWKLIILVVLAIIGSLLIYYNTQVKNNITSDEKKFKEEYESLNGKTNASNKKYLDVNISENNNIIYTSYEEIFNIIDNKKSAIIYFGFPECPWCRNAMPVLIEAASDYGVDQI